VSTDPSTLKVLHVDAERGFSGGEVQVLLLMEGLRGLGHRNTLACPPASRFEEAARKRGFEIVSVPMRGDLDLAAVVRLRRAVERVSPDLVHLHTGRATWLGGLAARWAERPALTTRRMDRPVKRGWRTRLIYQHLVTHAVAISPAVSRRLAEGHVAPGGLSTIASAVDPAALRDGRPVAEVRAELGLAGSDRVVLALASLVRRKGLDLLLEAFARLDVPDAVLLVGGEGPERGPLEARAAALGLGPRARFLGRREDKAALLAACDVFCLPSRLEGLGVAALEAMAAGRPVVASRVGGLGEAVVDGRTGILVPPGDIGALAAALARLLDDRALRESLGSAGPGRIAEGFRADQMVSAYERLYRRILNGVAA